MTRFRVTAPNGVSASVMLETGEIVRVDVANPFLEPGHFNKKFNATREKTGELLTISADVFAPTTGNFEEV